MPKRKLIPLHQCSICSNLDESHTGFQVYGQDQYNRYLPKETDQLEIIEDNSRSSSREKQIRQCKECGTYYYYWTDYEFLIGGSEDEQNLERLTFVEAGRFLNDSQIKNQLRHQRDQVQSSHENTRHHAVRSLLFWALDNENLHLVRELLHSESVAIRKSAWKELYWKLKKEKMSANFPVLKEDFLKFQEDQEEEVSKIASRWPEFWKAE